MSTTDNKTVAGTVQDRYALHNSCTCLNGAPEPSCSSDKVAARPIIAIVDPPLLSSHAAAVADALLSMCKHRVSSAL